MIKAIDSAPKPKFDPCTKCGGMPEFKYDQSQATFCIWVQCTKCGLQGLNDDSHGGARSYWESKQYEKQTTNFVKQTIKPIETRYKGYRFRSRLEARWAVFFDALGVKWEYEKEGYDLGDAGWYLPDFWLPDFDCFVEVKPDIPTKEQGRILASFACGVKPVLAVCGIPGGNNFFYCQEGSSNSGGELCIFDKVLIGYCHNCNKWVLDFGDWAEAYDNGNMTLLDGERELWKNPCRCSPPRKQRVSFGEMENAADAARSARFEHGEKPKF